MPLIVYFKNGTQLVIKGISLDPKEWKPGRIVKRQTPAGHDILILTSDINLIEYVPDEEYQRRIEEMRRQREEQAAAQASRIARPAMMIPRKSN